MIIYQNFNKVRHISFFEYLTLYLVSNYTTYIGRHKSLWTEALFGHERKQVYNTAMPMNATAKVLFLNLYLGSKWARRVAEYATFALGEF